MTNGVKVPGIKQLENMNINGKLLKDYSHKDCMRVIWLASQDIVNLQRYAFNMEQLIQHIALNYVPVSEQ